MGSFDDRESAFVSADVHLGTSTLVQAPVCDLPGRVPSVALSVGKGTDGGLHVYLDAVSLGRMLATLGEAQRELTSRLGLLPNGEPCRFVDVFGPWEWSEHDHDACLAELVDEPVPFVPAGTAWERRADPAMADEMPADVVAFPVAVEEVGG